MKSSALIILLATTLANCQFLYNYDEGQDDQFQPETQNYDTSAQQYNPPTAANRQYVQPVSDSDTARDSGRGRTRIRVRSRNYQSEPQPESISDSEPDVDHRTIRQERRQARRRQREMIFVQPPSSVTVRYSPSVFENVGLGEAPSGVYVPQDSLLNRIKSPSRTAQYSPNIAQPAVAPQTNVVPSGVYIPHDSLLNRIQSPSRTAQYSPNVAQPAVVPQTSAQPATSFVNSEPQSTFFVQPPSNQDYRQTNVILPVTRTRDARPYSESGYQAPKPAPVTETTRRQRPMRRRQEYRADPVVDIDSYRQYTDDVSREDLQVMPQVEYVPRPRPRQEQRRSQGRRRQGSYYQQTTPAPRVYSPSVFEKISLGEAPSGIYVPQDSLLNILRDPSASHHTVPRAVPRSSQQLSEQPSTRSQALQSDYLPASIEELEEVSPLPQPPAPPRRRSSQRSRPAQTSRPSERSRHQQEYSDQNTAQPVQSSQRSRPAQTSRPSERSRYQQVYSDQNTAQPVQSSQRSRPAQTSRHSERSRYQQEYRDQNTAQPVQSTSQRRSQQRNDDYDDYARIQPQTRHEAPPPKRERTRTAPRPQSQESSSNSRQSSRGQSYRKAKLAIAELPHDTDDDGIPGEAGVNYPTFHVIPKTSFSCSEQSHNGYYADLETSCQVVHLCQARGVQDSFLCPNGTIFSQEKFSCQWWYKVNCNDAPKFYIKNDELYKVPEKEEKKRSRNK